MEAKGQKRLGAIIPMQRILWGLGAANVVAWIWAAAVWAPASRPSAWTTLPPAPLARLAVTVGASAGTSTSVTAPLIERTCVSWYTSNVAATEK